MSQLIGHNVDIKGLSTIYMSYAYTGLNKVIFMFYEPYTQRNISYTRTRTNIMTEKEKSCAQNV